MVLCKRLIARLDIKGNRLIKGVRFEGLRVVGDPYQAALRYGLAGADELLYIDAVASLYGRNSLSEVLRHTSREIFIPITAGGGIRNTYDASELLSAGADKIAVNSEALKRPELISELAEAFGSQCVVASIQARHHEISGNWEAMADAGRERTGKNVLEWIEQVQELGAGEILLTSINKDGTCSGPDQLLLSEAKKLVNIPLIVGGGFSRSKDFEMALSSSKVSGVSCAAALHRNQIEIEELKLKLINSAIPIRLSPKKEEIIEKQSNPLSNINIGIIDYGMGNQQSLLNSLKYLGANVSLSKNVKELDNLDLIALPGVGAFPEGMHQLQKRGFDRYIQNWASEGKPLLGICLGMQMMFSESNEFKKTEGLNLLKGNIVSLKEIIQSDSSLILPHMGWNKIYNSNTIDTLNENGINQYFVHSYAAINVNEHEISHTCNYAETQFVAAIRKDRMAGFQFHPERSGIQGLILLARTIKEIVA